eukprot:COSAG02_NODE_872_length_16321_cov_6.491062_15_plen_175_part_00
MQRKLYRSLQGTLGCSIHSTTTTLVVLCSTLCLPHASASRDCIYDLVGLPEEISAGCRNKGTCDENFRHGTKISQSTRIRNQKSDCDWNEPVYRYPVFLIPFPSWEQPVIGDLSGELGASWELGTWEPTTTSSLGTGWEPGAPPKKLAREKLGAKKLAREPMASENCTIAPCTI